MIGKDIKHWVVAWQTCADAECGIHFFADKGKAEAWYETVAKKKACDIIHFGQFSKIWHKEEGN